MERLMDGVFARYGVQIRVDTAAGAQVVKGLLRSVTSDAWQNTEQVFSPLGETPRGRYICLLPAAVKIAAQDTLTVRNKSYLVRRVEEVAAFANVVCRWCLCVEKGSGGNGT